MEEQPDQDMPPERKKRFQVGVYIIALLLLVALGMSIYHVVQSARDDQMHPPPPVEGPQPLLPPQ